MGRSNGAVLELPKTLENGYQFPWILCQNIDFFRLLFLDEIPELSNGGDDSAKRFINLIDSVYDKKVGIICRAEVPPEKLYNSGKNTFEFQRTVSRLFEMQSNNWPNREKTC